MIYLIESPGLADITSGDRVGSLLAQQLGLMRIPVVHRPIHTKDLFAQALLESKNCQIVHISAHGSVHGLHFTDQSWISWKNLALAVSVAAHKKMVIISACESVGLDFRDLSGALAMFGLDMLPRYTLTHFDKVMFVDAFLSWGIFYRHVLKNKIFSTRDVYDALTMVKNSGLDTKICCNVSVNGSLHNISPWAGGGKNVQALEGL